MAYEDLAPAVDKWLRSDGAVVTSSGELLLPPDPARAEDFQNRAAAADKWLRPDGSIVDSAGNIILPPDESRALEYQNYSPGVGSGMPSEKVGVGFDVKEKSVVRLEPFAKGGDTLNFAFACDDGAAFAFVPYINESESVANIYEINDTATAVLS